MSLPGNLTYLTNNNNKNDIQHNDDVKKKNGMNSIPIRLSFHFKPAKIDGVNNTRNKSKLYHRLQPISPKKQTLLTIRPRTLKAIRRTSSGEVMKKFSPRTKKKINFVKKSETSFSYIINNTNNFLRDSSKTINGMNEKLVKQKKTKETKTHSNGKRLNIVCGVTIVPDIFLSIINSCLTIFKNTKKRHASHEN